MNYEIPEKYVSILKKHGYRWPPKDPDTGDTVSVLILISLGTKHLHDSGYPLVQVFGADMENNLYDLGVHDHIWFVDDRYVNVDSLGSNIFRMWIQKPMTIKYWITSSLEIENGVIR